MTSVLNVDTIANKAGTGPVARTKQEAARACYGVNLTSSEYKGIASNALSSENLNISSFSDGGTGNPTMSFTNSFSNAQYIHAEGALGSNNTANFLSGTSASSVVIVQKDADSNTTTDNLSCAAFFGYLA